MNGTKVFHSIFGAGTIAQTRSNRRELRIDFANGRSMWLTAKEVSIADTAQPPPSPPMATDVGSLPVPHPNNGAAANTGETPAEVGRYSPQRARHSPPSLETRRARVLIEALRLGIVPRDLVTDFTLLTDDQAAGIEQFLAEARMGRFGVLEAGYGFGKTHFLSYIRERALQQGFVVASVDFDLDDVRASNPKRFWREVAGSLTWQGQDGHRSSGLATLLKRVSSSHKGLHSAKDHVFFGPCLGLLQRRNDLPELADRWIHGQDISIPAVRSCAAILKDVPNLPDHTNRWDIYCHLLTGLSTMCMAMGHRGLIVTADEEESLDLLSSTKRERANDFIKALAYSCTSHSVGKRAIQGLVSGGKGRRYDPVFSSPAGLSFLTATTPDMSGEMRREFRPFGKDMSWIRLEQLTEALLNRLLELLATRYIEAWQHVPNRRWRSLPTREIGQHLASIVAGQSRSGEFNLRLCIKAAVEALDVARHHDAVLPEILHVVQRAS